MNDTQIMQLAITTGEQARPFSRPNPWVGAVVKSIDGELFSGSTSKSGGPHAEIMALNLADTKARGATLYTTLEPCGHTGRTPPCTETIIRSGIKKVLIGILDPDKKVNGDGARQLVDAGLEVEVGVCRNEISTQLKPYIYHRQTNKPFVVLKMAMTIDGATCATDGQSKWITGAEARKRVQMLRAQSDAIVVGANTVRIDNPQLTVRDVAGNSPQRFVFGKVADDANVHPCTQWTKSPSELVTTLGEMGAMQLLVEGGPTLATSFHQAGLINEYVFHIAPAIGGGAGKIFVGPGMATMNDIWRGQFLSVEKLGDDIEIILEVRNNK